MKITGNRSISSIIKIFLIILFAICIATIITVPIITENQGTGNFKQMIINIAPAIAAIANITITEIIIITFLFFI